MIAAPIKTQIWKCNQKSHQHPQMSTAMRCIEDDIRKEEKRQAYNKKIEAAHAKKRKIFLSVLNGLTVADAAQKFKIDISTVRYALEHSIWEMISLAKEENNQIYFNTICGALRSKGSGVVRAMKIIRENREFLAFSRQHFTL